MLNVEFYRRNYKTIFLAQLHVSTCPEMLLMELPTWQCKGEGNNTMKVTTVLEVKKVLKN